MFWNILVVLCYLIYGKGNTCNFFMVVAGFCFVYFVCNKDELKIDRSSFSSLTLRRPHHSGSTHPQHPNFTDMAINLCKTCS